MSEVNETVVTEQTPELPEQRHEYQPTDELGRPLGGKQVIKYRTQEELVQKLTQQNILVQRELREQKKKLQLGIDEAVEIPESAPRFDDDVEFTPRVLSADERVALSRDLLDPEKFEQATNTLFEATVGQTPAKIAIALTGLQRDNRKLLIEQEAKAFEQSVPDYFRCKENAVMIAQWLGKHNLAPIRDNFRLAFETLKKQGVLVYGPEPAAAVPATPAAPVVEPVVTETVTTQPAVQPVVQETPVVAIPTGITRSMSSGEGQPKSLADEIVYDAPIFGMVKGERGRMESRVVATKRYTGLAAVEAMPSEEFKRRVKTDKNFERIYERLVLGQNSNREARPV